MSLRNVRDGLAQSIFNDVEFEISDYVNGLLNGKRYVVNLLDEVIKGAPWLTIDKAIDILINSVEIDNNCTTEWHEGRSNALNHSIKLLQIAAIEEPA